MFEPVYTKSPKSDDYTRVARNQIIITCHGPLPTISWQHRALSTVILLNIRYILHVLYSIRNRCPRQDTPYLVVHHHSLRNYNGVTPCPDNPIATRSLLIDLSSPALHNDAEMGDRLQMSTVILSFRRGSERIVWTVRRDLVSGSWAHVDGRENTQIRWRFAIKKIQYCSSICQKTDAWPNAKLHVHI